MTDRVYDDERAMNIIASALVDLPKTGPDAFIETVTEAVELTGRDLHVASGAPDA